MLGVEELDGGLAGSEPLREPAARQDQALLHRFVDESEPMARGHQLERERQEHRPIVVLEVVRTIRLGAGEQAAELGQVLRRDEAELLEQLASRRDVREQIDHDPGDLPSDVDEIVHQPDIGQHLAHVGVRGKGFRIEGPVPRGAEEEVLRHRHVDVVGIAVEGIHEVRGAQIGEPRT